MTALTSRNAISNRFLCPAMAAAALCLFALSVSAQSSVVVRVMASNLTSGSGQSYITAGLDILQGLKPPR